MNHYNVLSVCGSGTVTSSLVSEKLTETLIEYGFSVSTTEARPTEAIQLAQGGNYDFIINTSPLPEGDYGIPIVNAIGFLTGFGEEEFIEEVLQVINKLKKE